MEMIYQNIISMMNVKIKNIFLIIIFILLIFIIIIIIIILSKSNKTHELFIVENPADADDEEETEKIEINLDPTFQVGNYLSCYFHNMGVAFSRGKIMKPQQYPPTLPVSQNIYLPKCLSTEVFNMPLHNTE
jgi:hypothetical protein